jgi:hypothetical protein
MDMTRIRGVILIYHRHKPINLISKRFSLTIKKMMTCPKQVICRFNKTPSSETLELSYSFVVTFYVFDFHVLK